MCQSEVCPLDSCFVPIFASPIFTKWIRKYITLKYIIDIRNVDGIICLHLLIYRNFSTIQSGSGYLAWRLKTIQRKSAEERDASASKSPKCKFTCQLQILLMLVRVTKMVFSLKLVGQAMVNPEPSQLTKYCIIK